MKKKGRKFYVVWSGAQPGIYDNWDDCRAQVHGQQGAQYKSFGTMGEAEEAFRSSPLRYIQRRQPAEHTRSTKVLQDPPSDRTDTVLPLPQEVVAEAWAVDAACSGNPGRMEYRGVDLRTGAEVFHLPPLLGTNNIGEFLAIVHALALIERNGGPATIYSDSRNAILWVKKKKCATKLTRNAKTDAVYDLIARAETWLATHTSPVRILKWETSRWGEIPADFGRK